MVFHISSKARYVVFKSVGKLSSKTVSVSCLVGELSVQFSFLRVPLLLCRGTTVRCKGFQMSSYL